MNFERMVQLMLVGEGLAEIRTNGLIVWFRSKAKGSLSCLYNKATSALLPTSSNQTPSALLPTSSNQTHSTKYGAVTGKCLCWHE